MYVCSECGALFDVPCEWTEPYGQRFTGSPCCRTNFDEAEYCECGNIKEPYHEYCEQCEEAIKIDNERVRDTA